MSDKFISDNNTIYDTEHKYFTLIPNMIFDMGLSPRAITLYCVLKKIAGDHGKCWMSTKNLAKQCGMSEGSISASKQELYSNNLIAIETKTKDNKHYHEIKIIDIWGANINLYTASSKYELADSYVELAGSYIETNKNSVNKNPILNEHLQKKLQDNTSYLANENGEDMNKEEYLESTRKALERGLANHKSDYAQFPEDVVPVVEKMVELWNFTPPTRKSKQFGFWVESCREVINAFGEFGVGILDKLHDDWKLYMNSNGGSAPYPVSSPKSLVSAVYGKAALLRGGSNAPMWKVNKPVRQSVLDV